MPKPPIQLKRSGTASATPSSLEHGELALNYADSKVFFKNASNTISSFTFQSYALASHTHAASDITSGTLDAARLPLATTIAAGAVIVGTGLGVSSGTVSVTYGTNSTSACRGDDSRLSDTRTPTDGSVTTAKLANDAVTYAKIQNVSATDRLLGRSSAGAGDVEEITCTAFGRSLIDDADAAAARSTLSVQPTASPAFTGVVQADVSNDLLDSRGNLRVFTTDTAAIDKGGSIGLGGKNGAGVFDPWAFGVIKGAKENATSGNFSGYLAFGTAGSGGTITERLRIKSTGESEFTGSVVVNNAGNVVPLTVTNTGTANSFVVNDESGDTTPFVVDADGRVICGAASGNAFDKFTISGTLPSGSSASVGFASRGTVPSASATAANYFVSAASTQAASFTLTTLEHYVALQGTFGAGSTVTNQYGFVARDTLIGATNNYGFYSNIASGSGRWNFYANGTAPSFFGGQLLVTAGSGSAGSYKPGIAVSGDDDTGLQQVGGAGTISIVTQGSERVRVDASGNVGIGVTPAASTTSNVQASGDITLYGASRSFLGNLYFQSGWKYAGTGHGWGWIEGSGNVDFARTSSSGTAGNTATLTTAIRINSGSEVLIGTTTDNGAYLLQVNSQIYATNATIATSDARFKTNVQSLTDATAVIEALRPVAFDFIPHAERKFATERQVGLIAQEAQSALAGTDYANSVVAQCGDHLGLAYEKLVPVLIKALQESNARIAALEERLNHA